MSCAGVSQSLTTYPLQNFPLSQALLETQRLEAEQVKESVLKVNQSRMNGVVKKLSEKGAQL